MTRETIHYVGRDDRGRCWARRLVEPRHLHHGRDMYRVTVEILPCTLSTQPAGPYYGEGPALTGAVGLGADLGQTMRNMVEQMRRAGL